MQYSGGTWSYTFNSSGAAPNSSITFAVQALDTASNASAPGYVSVATAS